jgi:hypothetical protein
MAQGTNKYGLKRSSLNAEIRRQLRQEAGFGCVVCGNAVGQYEHIDPPFSEAAVHDPDAMAFLCIQCHGKVTKGLLSKATVFAAKKKPKAKEAGFAFEAFDVGSTPPTVRFGPMSAKSCNSIITVNDKRVFWVSEPEVSGGPFRLGAVLRNDLGQEILAIEDNVWTARSENWDLEIVGRIMTLRNGPKNIALSIKTNPPNEIIVIRMDMSVDGYRMTCDQNKFEFWTPSGIHHSSTALVFEGCESAIILRNDEIIIGQGGGSVRMTGEFGGERTRSLPRATGWSRNASCRCGSGLRFKHCCGSCGLMPPQYPLRAL